jgi:parallel beta-helix repeat protein
VDDSNTVGPWNGTQDYPYRTIQEAVTIANAGDTIFVSTGSYNENLVITKDLTITGENKDTTFIDGGGASHVIRGLGTVDTNIQVSLMNFTIRNAGGGGNDCIHFSYITSSTISCNKVINSLEGEGISLDHCQGLLISNNTIDNNKIVGITLAESQQIIIVHNIIQNNQKGIQLGFCSNNQVRSNTIYSNSVYGVYVTQSPSNTFTQNDFVGNNQNAQDLSTNVWSTNNKGNYWDDYNKYDNNSDGIGDTPYAVPGGTNVDTYPLGYFKQPGQPGGGNQPPIAVSLSISKTSAIFNETITFSGEGIDTDGYIDGYHWRSNLDGTLSTQQSFSITTLSIGTHTIYFKVMDDDAAWSTEKTTTLTVVAENNQVPVASIDEITPNPAKQGDVVIFRGHGMDTDGVITAYKWLSSRDGVISTSASFLRANLSCGTHTIYFQVKDETEWSAQVTLSLIIEQNGSSGTPGNQAPIAVIGGPYAGKVNDVITFDGSGSYDGEGTIIAHWTFGDNITGEGLTSTHVYTSPGTYTVILTVVDEDGVSSTSSTSAVITYSSSQGISFEGISILDFEIPFPVLMILVVLLAVGLVIGFIYKIQRR